MICFVKTLAIAKLVYNTSVLTVPTNFAEKVNDICFKFIWNFKPDKIKRHTNIGPVDKGGLNPLPPKAFCIFEAIFCIHTLHGLS